MKQFYQMSFQEFVTYFKSNPELDPILVQDAWVHHVTEALKKGKDVPSSVLIKFPLSS